MAAVNLAKNVTFQGSPVEDAPMPSPSKFTAEIQLDNEVLRALCIRSRRRFRDMKAASQAELKLDSTRGVMQVTGSKSAIADIRKKLETVTGPCLTVAGAVWAELMRTRMNPDPEQGAVAQMQESSGCRLHIERDSKQVRLFGPKDQIIGAQKLLKELDAMCIEKSVDMQGARCKDLTKLDAFATEFGVTLQVDETQITVLGIEGAVEAAAKDLREHSSERLHPSGLACVPEGPPPAEVARSAIKAAISKLTVDLDGRNFSSPSSTCDSLPLCVEEECSTASTDTSSKKPTNRMKPKNMKQNDPFGVCSECGDCGCFCVSCGGRSNKDSSLPNACSACGAANFCVFCGHPTPKMKKQSNKGNMDSSQVYQQPDMACMDQSMMMPMQQMQLVPVGVYNGVSQMPAPDGSMVMMAPNMVPMQQMQQPSNMVPMQPLNNMVPMQQFPMMTGPTAMPNGNMQAYMMPMNMTFATAGYDVCC